MRQGFTLIQTLIYTLLIGIVVSALVSFCLLITVVKAKNNAMSEVNANAKEAVNIISWKIKSAKQVLSPAKGNAGPSLTLEMPDGNTAVINTADGIIKLAEDGATVNITNSQTEVTNLNFSNLGSINDSIKMAFAIQCANFGSQEYAYSQDIETAITLR